MRIVYLGTPDFSVLPLKSIIEAGYNVVAVGTNKDKPVGRKQVLTPTPVKNFACEKGIKVFEYDKIREEGVSDLRELNPDIIITCAFGQILSQEILDIPRLGVINIHASLLPQLRGASPIHFAILNGLKTTGVTIMKTVYEVDAGDVLIQKSINILENETMGELFERLSVLSAEVILDALKLIESGKAVFVAQDHGKATFTKMIRKEMAKIDWNKTNEQIFNQIRAFNPSPVAFTLYKGEPLKIYSASLSNSSGKAGEILRADNILEIACGKGSIIIEKLQKAGSKQMIAKDFLLGNKLIVGSIIND